MANGKSDPAEVPDTVPDTVEAPAAPAIESEAPVVTPEPAAVQPEITAPPEITYGPGYGPGETPAPPSDEERAAIVAEIAPPGLS
jgi:hypothetical protein